MHHDLKIRTEYLSFIAHSQGSQIRDNLDRQFRAGDTVRFQEWDECRQKYTGGESHLFRITRVWKNIRGLVHGYVLIFYVLEPEKTTTKQN